VALLLGGPLLVLGVVVFGLGYLLKCFLGWRSHRERPGMGEETFGDFLGASLARIRPRGPAAEAAAGSAQDGEPTASTPAPLQQVNAERDRDGHGDQTRGEQHGSAPPSA
jgi:hypothetical protein